MDRRRVLIVGGGIAGLALAPMLARTGVWSVMLGRGTAFLTLSIDGDRVIVSASIWGGTHALLAALLGVGIVAGGWSAPGPGGRGASRTPPRTPAEAPG
jgi:hypothetical protein